MLFGPDLELANQLLAIALFIIRLHRKEQPSSDSLILRHVLLIVGIRLA